MLYSWIVTSPWEPLQPRLIPVKLAPAPVGDPGEAVS